MNFAHAHHDRALAKARRLLRDDPAFDSFRFSSSLEAELEEERKLAVALALELSPTERIGSTQLSVLRKTGDFPFSEPRLCLLFGSIPDFQRACGFQPDERRATREMSPQAMVDLALSIRPDSSLNTNEVKTLSRHGEFVGYAAIRAVHAGIPRGV